MTIKVDNRKVKNENTISALKDKGNRALDAIWETTWVKDTVAGYDELIDSMHKQAEAIKYQSDIVVVIASGKIAALLKAALSALTDQRNKIEMIVIGDSLSTADHIDLINKVKNRKFSTIVISAVDERIGERGSYACVKKLLIDEYGEAEAAKHIHIVATKESSYFVEEAVNSGTELTTLADGINENSCANTAALLLPIMTAGIDGEAYMTGFSGMMFDTWWDLDAMDYSLYLAHELKENCRMENIWTAQRELKDLAEWASMLHGGADSRVIFVPDAAARSFAEGYGTYIDMVREPRDVILPVFPGCSEDGSLNQLCKETFEEAFEDKKDHRPRTKITIETMSPHDFGQLVAFIQISWGITSFILEN